MSKLSDLIFNNKEHYVTSPFGKRKVMSTSAGSTSSFHNGVDYGTNGKKISQYAIADGEILNCGVDTAYGNAKFVWVAYPSLGVKMLHYHLDSIKVTKGQKVKKGTALGTTGKTGKATGIHLHLGIKKLSGGDYFDAEQWSKDVLEKIEEPKKEETKPTIKATSKSYKVNVSLLRVRKGAGTNFDYKKFKELTKDAQNKVRSLNRGLTANGYVKGLTFTAKQIKTVNNAIWAETPSGWVCITDGKDIFCVGI